MALSLDTLSAHLPSQSSQTLLLLCTTLPASSAPVNTLVDSSAIDNFIDEFLAMLAAMPQRLPLPIHLTLFDGSFISTGDITHRIQTTLTFPNGQWQDFQLLVTHWYASAPLILGLPWLHSTNLRIDWWNLTLHFDCQTSEHLEPIPLDVTALASAANHPHTPLQLCLNPHYPHQQQGHQNTNVITTLRRSIVLDNGLQFLVNLLVTQLLETIPTRDLTMKFSGPGACLIAIHLCLQPTNDSSEAEATSAPTAPLNDTGNSPLPQHILGSPSAFLLNISCNKYKGPNYSAQRSQTTPNINNADQPFNLLNPEALDIKIIGLALFTCIIQDDTSAFQLHISLVLPEEHLGADVTTPAPKTEEQILHEVVPPEYCEFADVFSKGSTKELLSC
ncbi:hypothetical protein C0993_009147 [Termitomyces sp. T159_Od127]|nr:hypothetical protein C0993_009147 [Termitomyces sp. T159_Od127]